MVVTKAHGSHQVCFCTTFTIAANKVLALIYRKQPIRIISRHIEYAYSAHTLRRLSELCLRCLKDYSHFLIRIPHLGTVFIGWIAQRAETKDVPHVAATMCVKSASYFGYQLQKHLASALAIYFTLLIKTWAARDYRYVLVKQGVIRTVNHHNATFIVKRRTKN